MREIHKKRSERREKRESERKENVVTVNMNDLMRQNAVTAELIITFGNSLERVSVIGDLDRDFNVNCFHGVES